MDIITTKVINTNKVDIKAILLLLNIVHHLVHLNNNNNNKAMEVMVDLLHLKWIKEVIHLNKIMASIQ